MALVVPCMTVPRTYPPVCCEHREGQVVDDMVGVLCSMGVLLHASSEAGQAQVKVGTLSALDAHAVADIIVAVVAVEQRPAPQQSFCMSMCTACRLPQQCLTQPELWSSWHGMLAYTVCWPPQAG